MENKHTPGSWGLMSPGNAVWSCYVTSDAGLVATAHGATKEEAEANAARIAASPDLLDALREFIEYARSMDAECLCGDLPDDSICMTCKAKAAISKAEGK